MKAEKTQEYIGGAGEEYTHRLIAISKSYRPTAGIVSHFLAQVIDAGATGPDHYIEFRKVVKAEPTYYSVPNPFTGKQDRRRMRTRRKPNEQRLDNALQLVDLAESELEYEVSVISSLPPANPPLDVGSPDKDAGWRRWEGAYHLAIRCCVRDSVVRLSQLSNAEGKYDLESPSFDDDCAEGELDGLFVHPESPIVIPITGAGSGRFWIEFEYGKFIYPRLGTAGLSLLRDGVRRLAMENFETPFVEACSWT
jgi:hypothetical protein